MKFMFYILLANTLGVLISAGTNLRKIIFPLNVWSEILCFWPIKFCKNRAKFGKIKVVL